MASYQAIFFDRDGTLSRNSRQRAKDRDRAIGRMAGCEGFCLSHEMNMEVFWRVMALPGIRPVNTLAREGAFWRKWYQLLLEDHGVNKNSEAFAAELYGRFCFHRMMELFPETIGVLEALKARAYRLGVISDTFPSLEESLKAMRIARYFGSFTASSLVGVGKPDPKIFQAATRSLGVAPEACVYVDDYRVEADGAREQSFTAFHLDRERAEADFGRWTIADLSDVLEFWASRLLPEQRIYRASLTSRGFRDSTRWTTRERRQRASWSEVVKCHVVPVVRPSLSAEAYWGIPQFPLPEEGLPRAS